MATDVNGLNATFARAANAYKNQASLPAMPGMDDGDSGPSFGDMVGDALKKAVDTQHSAEKQNLNAVAGKVELTDLIGAVSQAELTLNTVVAVRDRVISAYQDILRMPI